MVDFADMKAMGLESARGAPCRPFAADPRQRLHARRTNLQSRKTLHVSAAQQALEKAIPDWTGKISHKHYTNEQRSLACKNIFIYTACLTMEHKQLIPTAAPATSCDQNQHSSLWSTVCELCQELRASVIAGDALLSRLVNAAIGFKPLYSVMKILAKQVMQNTAEKNGIPWRQRVKDLYATPEVRKLLKRDNQSKAFSHDELHYNSMQMTVLTNWNCWNG